MQVKGKTIVLTALAVALVMSTGAWWYHYRASRQAAQFWGPEATRLLIGKGQAAFFELAALDEVGDSPASGDAIAGRAIVKVRDLTDQPGLIHLRHALTQDASFEWAGRRSEPIDPNSDWAYAMQFADDRNDGEFLWILWRSDFKELGMVAGGELAIEALDSPIDVLPCPRLAPAVQAYLRDVGAL